MDTGGTVILEFYSMLGDNLFIAVTCKIRIVILFMSRMVAMCSWVNFYRSRLMRQGKGSYQERHYSGVTCQKKCVSPPDIYGLRKTEIRSFERGVNSDL